MLRITLHAIIAGFLRRTWLVAVVTVSVCASFAAHAVAALRAPAPTALPHSAPPPRPAPAASRTQPDGTGLVARNMFCSSCEPSAGGPDPSEVSFSGHLAVLISTTSGRDPRATVRVPATEVQGSWGLGERIPGVGTVARIGAASIEVVDAAGLRATLSLRVSEAAGAGAGAATPAIVAPAAGPFAARIEPLGDGTYVVDRDLVRELVSGAARPGAARMVPIVKAGEVQGVRLLGVGAGSIPAAIGMRTGDVISALDGTPIKSAQQLLDLYARLDQLASVELQGSHAGKPLAITLRLR